MLSGFVMFYSYGDKISEEKTDFWEYAYGRIVRIFPMYLTALFLSAVLILISRYLEVHTPTDDTASNFILSLFGIHYLGFTPPKYSFDPPAWFISVLLFLYAVFFFVCNRSKTHGKLAVKSILMIFLGLCMQRAYWLAPDIYLPLFNLDIGRGLVAFFSGVLLNYVYRYIKEFSKPKKTAVILILFLTVTTVYIVSKANIIPASSIGEPRIFCSLFLFPAVVLIVLNTPFIGRFLDRPMFVFLDGISYYVYLFHYPVIMVLRILKYGMGFNIDFSTGEFFLMYLGIIMIIGGLAKLLDDRIRKKLMNNKEAFVSFFRGKINQ